MTKIHKLTQREHKELDNAVSDHQLEKIKKLIDLNPDILASIDAELLKTALYFFDAETLKLLLSYNLEINYRDPQGYTILTSAVLEYNAEAVTLLLQAGAVLDESHPIDKSAKSCALKKNPEIAALLDQAAQGELTSEANSLPSTATNSSDDEEHTPPSSKFFLPHSFSPFLRQRPSASTTTKEGLSIEMISMAPRPARAPHNTHPHID